jgi:NhaP-type Na+/H+ or K+/H+ antiporter
MDRSTNVTLGGFLAGLIVGIGVGWLWAVFRRAWRDHSGAQAATAAVGRAKWRRTGDLVFLGFLLAVAAALALGGHLAGRR